MSEHLADTNVGNIEYIRRKDASDWLKQYGQDVLHGKYKFSLMYIWKNIMDLPSADVVQVRHGKWINEYWHSEKVRKCSVCRITQTVNVYNGEVKFNYCPYCGAKMDARGEE